MECRYDDQCRADPHGISITAGTVSRHEDVAKQQTHRTHHHHHNNNDDFNGTKSWLTSAILIVIEIVIGSSIQKRDNRIHTHT